MASAPGADLNLGRRPNAWAARQPAQWCRHRMLQAPACGARHHHRRWRRPHAHASGAAASPSTNAATSSSSGGGAHQPPAAHHHQASPAHATHPAHLTALLSGATDVPQLTLLLHDHAHMLNAVHVSAALVRASRLQPSAPSPQPHAPTQQHPPAPSGPSRAPQPRVSSNGTSSGGSGGGRGAAARGQQAGASPVLAPAVERLVAACAAALLEGGLLARCGPRELANVCWALARLGWTPAHLPALGQALLAAVLDLDRPPQRGLLRASSSFNAPPRRTGLDGNAGGGGGGGGGGRAANERGEPATLPHAAAQGGNGALPPSLLLAPAAAGWDEGPAQQQQRQQPGRLAPVRRRAAASSLQAAAPQALCNMLWALAHWYPPGATALAGPVPHGSGDAAARPETAQDRPRTLSQHTEKPSQQQGGWGVEAVAPSPPAEPASFQGRAARERASAGQLALPWHEQQREQQQQEQQRRRQLEEALEALCAALLRALPRCSPQDLALSAWALGALRFAPRRSVLLRELTLRALPASCAAQTAHGLSIAAWGCAQLLQLQAQEQRRRQRQQSVADGGQGGGELDGEEDDEGGDEGGEEEEGGAGERGRGNRRAARGELLRALGERAGRLAPELARRPAELSALMRSLRELGYGGPGLWRLVQAEVRGGKRGVALGVSLCVPWDRHLL